VGIISCRLDEQLADKRSNQVALRLQIDNASPSPVRLLRVEARVPDQVLLIEVRDRSLTAATTRRIAILEELTRLLHNHLLFRSKPFQTLWVERQQELMRETFSPFGLFRAYYFLLFRRRSWERRLRRNFETFAFQIDSLEDARNASARWTLPQDPTAFAELFAAKVDQLERLDGLLHDADRRTLAVIESGSYYAATYVLECPRSSVESQKYQVTVEAACEDAGSATVQLVSTTATIQISPSPIALSMIAIFGALLGGMIDIAFVTNGDFWNAVANSARNGKIIIAPGLALVLFNVYEYTSIGKNLTMSISWRSALLIGTLCGLAEDRILAALKAFLGPS
jgi:hypothetical protein